MRAIVPGRDQDRTVSRSESGSFTGITEKDLVLTRECAGYAVRGTDISFMYIRIVLLLK